MQVYVIVISSVDVSTVKQRWFKHGLTTLDLATSAMLIWIHIISVYILLVLFRRSAQPLSELCHKMSKTNKELNITEKSLQSITKRTYSALLVLFILHLMSVGAAYSYSAEIMSKIQLLGLYIPSQILYYLVIFIFFWPFPAAASFVVNRQCLFNMIVQLQTYRSKIPLKECKNLYSGILLIQTTQPLLL